MSRTGSIARLRASVNTSAERMAAAVQGARRRWTAVDVLFAAGERDRRVAGGVLAGAVAFRLFVYLLPLFLALISLLGIAAGLDADSPEWIGDQLGMSSYLIDSVETAAEQSQRGLWALIPLALWTTYFTGVGAVKVLRASHALAWGQPVHKLRHAWIAAGASFGFIVLVIVIAAGTQAIRQQSAGAGIGFAVAQVTIFVALWWGASRVLPHDPRAGWMALLPGAVVVGVGLWVLHVISVYLLARRVESASALYGSLGVAAAILAWLYLLGRLVVVSAMLNATLWERSSGVRPSSASALRSGRDSRPARPGAR